RPEDHRGPSVQGEERAGLEEDRAPVHLRQDQGRGDREGRAAGQVSQEVASTQTVARWRTAPKRHRCVPQPAQFSDPTFEDLRDQSRAFAAIAQYATSTVNVSVGDTRWRIEEASVSRQFFDVLGSRPTRGRTFTEDELAVGAAP